MKSNPRWEWVSAQRKRATASIWMGHDRSSPVTVRKNKTRGFLGRVHQFMIDLVNPGLSHRATILIDARGESDSILAWGGGSFRPTMVRENLETLKTCTVFLVL